MGPVKYYSLLIKKKIYQILLILQNRIIIPIEHICVYKITLVPSALMLKYWIKRFFIFKNHLVLSYHIIKLYNLVTNKNYIISNNNILYTFYKPQIL